jgi:hypothetical protein
MAKKVTVADKLDVVQSLVPREKIAERSPGLAQAIAESASVPRICKNFRTPIIDLFQRLDRTTSPATPQAA